MLAARSEVVAGRRMTGFNDSVAYPELVVQPDAEAAGAIWVQDAPVVVDRNLVTSPDPRHSAAFSAAIVDALRGQCSSECCGIRAVKMRLVINRKTARGPRLCGGGGAHMFA